MLAGTLEPFYFGSPNQPLFGCYHSPKAGPSREVAVVLCYPMGEEYIRFHRALRQLAERLSRVGFPVLRFDFYGCGDSAGDAEEGGVAQWPIDVCTAIDEVKRRSGARRICLAGLRFGGTLSTIVSVDRNDVYGIVLWDPVIIGSEYLDELRRSHREMLWRAHVKPLLQLDGQNQTELLGFPITNSMMTDLESMNLLGISKKPADHILVVESHEGADQKRFVDHLKGLGAQVTYEQTPLPQLWIHSEDVGRILVPQEILQSVVTWISEVQQ